MVRYNEKSLQTKEKKEISGELEEEKVSLNILPVDVYDDPKLKQSIATTLQEDIDIKDKKSDLKNEESEKVQKNSKNEKKDIEKKTMPSDGYADPNGKTNTEFVDNSEIAKIIQDESRKIMPAPRVYNGVLPSSSYPGFSKSRVNLIN